MYIYHMLCVIVMYVPFCVYWLIVLLCVLFVCKCVLDYYHRVSTKLQLKINNISNKIVVLHKLNSFWNYAFLS
jgi:hypothetical protein